MTLKTIFEKIADGRRLTDIERTEFLDWAARSENAAPNTNPQTGAISIPFGPTQNEINAMVETAVTSSLGSWFPRVSDMTQVFGIMRAGEFRTGNGKSPGDGFTGGRFGWPGFSYSGTEYFLAGVAGDVLQIGLSLADGKLYAGAGAVVLGSTSSTIGGWEIGADYLQDAAGMVGLSSAITGADDIRQWAGNVDPTVAPFRVTESGALYAESATVSGTITASAGSFGGWQINASQIYKDNGTDNGIYLDSALVRIEVGDANGVRILLDGANERIRSSNFATGASGFNIAADTGDAEFNNITARGELKTFLLTSSNQMAVGGNIIVSKDAGKLGADVSSGATTVNFGKAMTVGNWIKIQGPDSAGSNNLEWMLVGSNVSGFTYNVTRNVDGSGANGWLKDTPFTVIGASGDSRIEIVAGASGSIQLITQGAAWNTQTVQASMSTVAGAITAGGGNVVIDQYGIYIANNQQGSFGFKDTGGNRDNLFIYSDNADGLGIINRIAGKAILQTIKLTDASTPSLRWREHPSTANLSQFQINTGSTATQIEIGNDIILVANRDGQATVFNELSNDIDFRIESATNANFFFLDAGAESLSIDGKAEFNISNADLDFIVHGDTQDNVLVVNAGSDRVEIGNTAAAVHILDPNSTTVFNEPGNDLDLRIESDTDANNFYSDAGANRVGIGTASPGSKLDVAGSFQCDSITNDTGLASGTYAPTCTGVANVDSTSAVANFAYMRVGSVVIVSGNINIDATTVTTLTRVRVTLPVASDLTNAGDLTGTGGIQGSDDVVIAIGDTTNNAAEINYTCNGTANTVVRLLFMYEVK